MIGISHLRLFASALILACLVSPAWAGEEAAAPAPAKAEEPPKAEEPVKAEPPAKAEAPKAEAPAAGPVPPMPEAPPYDSTVILDKMVNTDLKAEHEAQEADAKAKLEAFKKEQKDVYDAQMKTKEASFEFGGQTVKYTEPRDAKTVPTPAAAPYKSWCLKAEDFKFDFPAEVFEHGTIGPDGVLTKDRTYFVLPYTIANSLPDKVALAPTFTMVTDGGVFTPEKYGFAAHESVEASTFSRRLWTPEMIGFVRDTKEVAFFAPGQTKEGVAIFPRYDPGTTGVSLLIEGLSNDLDFRRDLRKALVLEFVRPGNVFYPGQTKLAFRRRIGGKLIEPKPGYLPSRDDDAHHGYDWVWLWNWEIAARAEEPKSTEMPTPTGLDKQKFWSYKMTLPNRTGETQPLTVVRVETIVRIEVMGKVVDVPFVDDGRLDVYKTGLFEKEGLPVTPRRFPERIVKKVGADGKVDPADDNRVKPGEEVGFLVAFRESDFDFDSVCTALVHALQTEMLTERNKDGGKKDMNKFFPNMKFGAAEMEKAKVELSGKVSAALSEQLKTRVLARVTLKSGLASGTHLIDFSLYKPAFVPPAAKQP